MGMGGDSYRVLSDIVREDMQRQAYPPHWSRAAVETGLASGSLRRAEIHVLGESVRSLESAYVRMGKWGEEDWVIRTSAALNRAMDGDQVSAFFFCSVEGAIWGTRKLVKDNRFLH